MSNYKKTPDSPGMNLGRNRPDTSIATRVKQMRVCSEKCPMYDSCAVMPMAIKPDVLKDRVCLVNAGPADLRMSWINLFLRGQPGLEEEIKNRFISYCEEFDKAKVQLKKRAQSVGQELTFKEQERLLHHQEKMVNMLFTMDKVLFGEKKIIKTERQHQEIIIEQIGGDGQPLRMIREPVPVISRGLSREERAEYDLLEMKKLEELKPDPESLVFSEKMKEILPSMIVVKREEEGEGINNTPTQ